MIRVKGEGVRGVGEGEGDWWRKGGGVMGKKRGQGVGFWSSRMDLKGKGKGEMRGEERRERGRGSGR